MKNAFLHVVVFVCGAAVLALEILGTRILGPFYGVSLFLWSALITVTLAALSLGYAVGGYWADRSGSTTRLCVLIMSAGIWIISIPLIRHPFLALAEPLGLRFAVLVAAVVLFFIPLMLLGTVNPFAIKLKTAALSEVGRTAGNLYAISTLAGVVSALATGFFLIPNVGVTNLTLIIGCVLVTVGAIGLLTAKRTAIAGIGIAAAIVLVVAGRSAGDRDDVGHGLLAVRQSPYAELRVLDAQGNRHLLIDGGIHTLVDTATWASMFHYTAVMDLPKYFHDKPGNMLLIGLRGGSLARQYATDGWRVDAVEIDPTVIQFAREYFHLGPADGTIYEMDGRQFLSAHQKTYDVILLDAFGSSSIPFHLVTKEVFNLIALHLNQGGTFALNVETIGWDDPIVKTLTATLRQAFREVVVLPIEEPPNRFGNLILMASNSGLEPKRDPEKNETFDPDWRYGPGYQKVHAWDNHFTPDITDASILTDDLNPIDLRAGAINLASRRGLHEYFEKIGRDW